MKKLLLAVTTLIAYQMEAQNYFGTQFIGEGGNNVPQNVSRVGDKIIISGLLGASLTGNFPISFKGGNADGILTSLSATDGSIQWIKQFGGGGDEVVIDATIDASGNYYVTGYMNSAGSLAMDADPGPGVYPLAVTSSFANRDIFLIKLDPNGDFLWAKKMTSPSGSPNDDVATIKVDSAGNILLAGSFIFINFDPNSSNQLYTAAGNSDGFILKLDSNGNFIWVKTLAGTSTKKIVDMELDANDNIYVTGRYQGTIDLNPDSSATDIRTNAGSFDTFVAKYTSTGDYVWGHSYGSTGSETPEKIAVKDGYVYVGGAFSGTVDLDPSAGVNMVTSAGGSDAYLSKFSTDGAYNSSFVIPGTTTNADSIRDFFIDNDGRLYLSGLFQNITIGGNNYISNAANSDAFYLKLNSDMTFSNMYLIQGNNIQAAPLFSKLDNNKFLALGASRGATDFDYTNNVSPEVPSNALYYIYLTKFDYEITLATSDLSSKSKLSIYPNPAKNNLNIQAESKIKTVSIYNTEGRKVYTIEKLGLTNINVSMLPNGVYYLQTKDEKGNINQTKFIKN